MDKISVKIKGKIDYLHVATTLTREICCTIKHHTLPEDFINKLELAMSEACTNAILHGSRKENELSDVMLLFYIYDDKLIIEVKDQGEGFDFTNMKEPDFEEHKPGGYGVFIIKSSVDKAEYLKEDDWNTLRMIKYFK